MQKLTITSTQRLFFREHGYIAFDNILSLTRIHQLRSSLQQTLAHRLGISQEGFSNVPIHNLYAQGYDCWREEKEAEQLFRNKTLLAIASELFNAPLLRIGFDQLLVTNGLLDTPFKQNLAITDLSCIKPLAGGILIALKTRNSPTPLPTTEGHLLFISHDVPLPWPQFFATRNSELFLLAFAKETPLYHLEKRDPHHLIPRKWGYEYGDVLEAATHPVLWRR